MLTAVLVVVVTTLLAYVYHSRRKVLRDLSDHGIIVPPTNMIWGNLGETEFAGKPGHLVQTDWVKKYGKVYGKYNGLRKRVVIADLEVIHRVMIKDFQTFTNRPLFGKSKMLINMEDQRWKNVRRIMSPTFSSRKMKKMFDTISDCVELMVQVVEEKAKSGEGFDVYASFQALTLDVIGRCALAMNIECQTDPKNYVLELVRKFFGGRIPPIIVLIICFPAFEKLLFPFHMLLSRGPRVERVICENILRVMKQRRENLGAYKHVSDVLQLLLESQQKGSDDVSAPATDLQDGDPFAASVAKQDASGTSTKDSSEKPVELTDDEIAQNAWMFLLAGYETTSNALAYTMHHLCKHPEIQEKIREEILAVTGVDDLAEADGGVIDYGVVNKLEYLQQVLDESMRICPPVPMFVSRRCGEDYPIPGYEGMVVPKDAVIEVPIWYIHHDPEIYPDPEVFDPERFTAEEKAKRHPMAYLPFGAGPRICIGMRFALLEAKLCLARLLARFSFVPDKKLFQDPLPTKLRFAILNPEGGVWVKAESRRSQ